MEHLIRWNPGTREHFCTKCGRTSAAISIADAQEQLEQFECEIPSVEAPSAEPGLKTQRINRKSHGRLDAKWRTGE
jgi:hypothetical protein